MRVLFFCVLFFSMTFRSTAVDTNHSAVNVNGRSFSVNDIIGYYRQAKKIREDITPREFLDAFVLQQLYIADARSKGEDTTARFKFECQQYRERITRKCLLQKREESDDAFQAYMQKQPDRLVTAHILCAVVPKAPMAEKENAKKRADELYHRLQHGEPFELLASEKSDDSFSAPRGGLLPSFCRGEFNEAFEEAAFALQQDGDVSVPVLTSYGWHIIKRIGIEPPKADEQAARKFKRGEQRKNAIVEKSSVGLSAKDSLEISRLSEEFDNNMLIVKSQKRYKLPAEAVQLSAYFERNKKRFRLKKPVFKGVVVECADKKIAKQVKKQLKKNSSDAAVEQLKKEYNSSGNSVLKIEKGVYLPGQNLTVDKRAFKRKDIDSEAVYKESFVHGKVLKKKPETYLDVKEEVIAEWEVWQNQEIKKLLSQKYPVEIDEDVLKTVNFDETIVF